jgi:hypothetical protein
MRTLIVSIAIGVSLSSSVRVEAAVIDILTDFQGVRVGYVSPVGSSAPGITPILGPVLIDGSALGLPSSFEAYCVDIVGAFNGPGEYDASVGSMSDWIPTQPSSGGPFVPPVNAGAKAAWLYNEFHDDAAGAGADANRWRTALQMAIWNVLYDSDTLADAGAFYISSDPHGVTGKANEWLAALGENLSDAAWLQVDLPDGSEPGQDFIGPMRGENATVPEPSTLVLLIGGIVSAAVARRRRWGGAERPPCEHFAGPPV